jgi:integrase/recombinase XerC
MNQKYALMLQQYLEYLTVMKMSVTYHTRMKDFFKYLSLHNLELDSLRDNDVYHYLTMKDFKSNSLNTFLRAAKHFYKYLGGDIYNPFLSFKALPVDKKIPNYLTEEELEVGIRFVIGECRKLSPNKIKAVLNFLFYTGLRRGEMLNIRRADIALNTDPVTVHVRVPNKGKKERLTFFPSKLKGLLSTYFKEEAEETNAFNLERWHVDYMSRVFRGAFPKKKISPHVFRHSFAKHLIKHNTPVNIVAKLLGHASTEVTLLYVDPDEQMLRDIYAGNI